MSVLACTDHKSHITDILVFILGLLKGATKIMKHIRPEIKKGSLQSTQKNVCWHKGTCWSSIYPSRKSTNIPNQLNYYINISLPASCNANSKTNDSCSLVFMWASAHFSTTNLRDEFTKQTLEWIFLYIYIFEQGSKVHKWSCSNALMHSLSGYSTFNALLHYQSGESHKFKCNIMSKTQISNMERRWHEENVSCSQGSFATW